MQPQETSAQQLLQACCRRRMNTSLNKAGGQEIYQVSEARRPALEGEDLVFPPDQGLYTRPRSLLPASPNPSRAVGGTDGLWAVVCWQSAAVALWCWTPIWLSCDAAASFLSHVSCCPRNRGKNPSRQALLLHSRQHLLSLSKTVYGCIIKPLPESQQWVQNLPKKPGKASHPPNFPSPKSAERVNRHFPTLLQVYGEQQEAVLLYIYYIYLLKNIF